MPNDDSDLPIIVSEGNLDAPFGKRIFDKAVIKKFKGMAKFKFWGFFILLIVMWLLTQIFPSDRVRNAKAKPIHFNSDEKDKKLSVERVSVPPLVGTIQRDVERPIWKAINMKPIQVLSFMGAKEIPPGAEAKAILLTGATNGLIKAKLIEPLKVDGVSLLEAGVLLLGQGHSTEERLFVNFSKAVFRDGKHISVSAQAYDLSDSILGLKGSLVGTRTLKLAASAGLYFLSGMAAGLREPPYDESGRPRKPNVGDAALNGASQAGNEQAKTYMQDLKNRPAIMEVKSGTTFVITFDGGG